MSLIEPGAAVPVVNQLPGEPQPYYLAAGEGDRYEINGALYTVIARPEDTGGLHGAYYVTGGRGYQTPFASHASEHQTVIVFDGVVEFWLGGEGRVLAPGDEVLIPANTPYSFRFTSNYTRIMVWSVPGTSVGLITAVGKRVDARVRPNRPTSHVSTEELREHGQLLGITYPDAQRPDPVRQHDAKLPGSVEPYYLSAGEGERRTFYKQLNTFISRATTTGSDSFAVHTTGGRDGYIPLHFHERHTENFLCLEGRIWLYVNGREVLLTKGDVVHAPPGTIHSFSFDANHTQMVGFLGPAIFEKFFDYMYPLTDDTEFVDQGEPYFPGEAFGRVQSELDVVVVGPPPTRTIALDL
ncbi:quercetin 2,3-dioxygenase [Lysinibacter cavernae]|uniref:Quercetin 2,3-dioxygenase n=1 Tax=Lysinibacter cavernae TaxID=1640652 RepID=A0A7X5R2B8_9MICO|nr:quercetin 2,3-dioxygenase [Lysinibacter cavernae]NIH54390.1 quercetin 2,3-dioxygenase [Lysinibacter cavernae]